MMFELVLGALVWGAALHVQDSFWDTSLPQLHRITLDQWTNRSHWTNESHWTNRSHWTNGSHWTDGNSYIEHHFIVPNAIILSQWKQVSVLSEENAC